MNDIYSETVRIFSDAGIAGLVLLVLISFIFVFWRLLKLTNESEQKRDEYESKRNVDTIRLIEAQIKIMNAQQAEFGKLNSVIIESLKEKNELLEKNNKTSAKLATAITNLAKLFDIKQNETTNALESAISYLKATKENDTIVNEKLQLILDQLNSERQNTMLMASIVDRLAKKISAIEANNAQFCVKWKEALSERLKSIDTRIELIQEGIKNEKEIVDNHSVSTS